MTTSSWYRRSLWNYKGNKEYTRTGFDAASVKFSEQDLDEDCTDRHYMITGSNSGIGLQVAMEVARRGGVIHMVCRNEEKAKAARSEIITTTGNDKIHLHILDLAHPRDVIVWSQKFAAQHEKLHVLVNNAGCMVHERQMDEDGVEANFAVNVLAVHILTLTLLPILQRNEDPRVVMVSSARLLYVRLDPHDLMHTNMEPFTSHLVYSQNKRQQVVMSLWYAQRYNNVHFSSMHPGWADTASVQSAIPEFYETMKGNLRTAAQGADTVVWLAISKATLKHPSGLFYQDREPVPSHLPLAWTKSSIGEEDLFMKNVHEVFLRIYKEIFPPAVDTRSEDAPATPDTATTAATSSQPSADNTSQPSADSTSSQPSADSTSPQPSADSTSPEPSADSTSPQPSADSTSPQPSADSTSSQPSADSTSPQPSADSTSPQLSADSASPQPLADSASSQPSAGSTNPQPSADSTSSQPTTDSTSSPQAGTEGENAEVSEYKVEESGATQDVTPATTMSTDPVSSSSSAEYVTPAKPKVEEVADIHTCLSTPQTDAGKASSPDDTSIASEPCQQVPTEETPNSPATQSEEPTTKGQEVESSFPHVDQDSKIPDARPQGDGSSSNSVESEAAASEE